ncbi:MAG: exodeoxyribonuclease VII small subunit [Treponema sp.]|nr:exodeoxyribonuclease VII small subunit [Treponema sp.]
MDNFEEKLKKLEEITNNIKRDDISLEEALKNFEEGIKLSKGMEEELNKVEGRIQILMTEPSPLDKNNQPVLDDFNADNELIGTRK